MFDVVLYSVTLLFLPGTSSNWLTSKRFLSKLWSALRNCLWNDLSSDCFGYSANNSILVSNSSPSNLSKISCSNSFINGSGLNPSNIGILLIVVNPTLLCNSLPLITSESICKSFQSANLNSETLSNISCGFWNIMCDENAL